MRFISPSSYSLAGEWKEMQEDSEGAKATIEEQIGGEVELGWSTENGEITYSARGMLAAGSVNYPIRMMATEVRSRITLKPS